MDEPASAPKPDTLISPAEFQAAASMSTAMLRADLQRLAGWYLALVAPSLLAAFGPFATSEALVALQLVQKLLELCFAWYIGRNWVKRLCLKDNLPPDHDFKSYATIFLGLWLLLGFPYVLLAAPTPPIVKWIALASLVPVVAVILRHFFFFVPALIGIRGIQRGLAMSRRALRGQSLLPLKVLVGPIGIGSLLSALVLALGPDEHSAVINCVHAFCSEIDWVLLTYLALAVGLRLIPEADWHNAGLDPYRESRLQTLAVREFRILSKALGPAIGFQLLLLSIVVWTFNVVRVTEMAPRAVVTVVDIAVEDQKVALTLDVSDPNYSFRGFRPVYFSLRDESGEPLALYPQEAVTEVGGKDVLFAIPSSSDSRHRILLTFATTRSDESLVRLQDLHLWYRKHRLILLDMARGGPQAPGPDESEESPNQANPYGTS